MASVLNEPYFSDEQAAFDRLEAIVWPHGIVCPHCGVIGEARPLRGVKDKAGRTRIGLKKCYACRKQFTVRVGTVFEASHVPLHIWFQACFLMCSSKKGISSNQLHRTLGVTLKTAWFMSHRLREAMRVLQMEPLGGAGKEVEADETFIGQKRPKARNARGYAHKHAVVSLVERGGQVHSAHVNDVNSTTLRPILKAQIKADSMLMTDEAGYYRSIGREFKYHFTVQHGIGEYVRGGAHTNTIEGFFSIFKRGMTGVYQHCSSAHLKRYLAEFDFRYNQRVALGVNDPERTTRALRGIMGKRLTYRESRSA
ncbi:MAG: IS1595 family transposase [Alphaproteobacteria bacterium]|nr:IS1595 family transposase [Alphaproteobacteria bacterium]